MCFPEGLENILFTKHFRISYSFTLLFTYAHIEKKVWKKALLERKKVLSPRLCNIGQNKRQVELAILCTLHKGNQQSLKSCSIQLVDVSRSNRGAIHFDGEFLFSSTFIFSRYHIFDKTEKAFSPKGCAINDCHMSA